MAEIDPEILDHFNKVSKSLINDFFDGEQAIQSEQFFRYMTGQTLLTKEEVQERTEKYIAKEKEIWGVVLDDEDEEEEEEEDAVP